MEAGWILVKPHISEDSNKSTHRILVLGVSKTLASKYLFVI
jgi:hypothetical protein